MLAGHSSIMLWFEIRSLFCFALRPKNTPSPSVTTPAPAVPSPASRIPLPGLPALGWVSGGGGGGGGSTCLIDSGLQTSPDFASSMWRIVASDSAYDAFAPVGSFSKYMQKYFNASTGFFACLYSLPTFDSRIGFGTITYASRYSLIAP